MTTIHRSLACAASLAFGLFTACAAEAGPLRASASLTSDPAGVVNVQSNTGSAYAAYPSATQPVASALAGRRHLVVQANAAGNSASFGDKYSGSADATTSYALWNLAENRALTDAEAAGLTLSFNFNISGATTAGGNSHERSVGFSGLLSYQAYPFAVAFGDNAALTQDPFGQVAVGNQNLIDSVVDEDYSLLHQGVASGEVAFSLFAIASLDATVYYDLWLESVTLVPGQALRTASFSSNLSSATGLPSNQTFDITMGLGVRLLGDDGEMIVVVPAATAPNGVPAPATLGLVLVGMAAMRPRRRTPR